jgi:parallel beta-helix repeat protein
MTTISGAGAHALAAITDRIPASKAGAKGYLTAGQLLSLSGRAACVVAAADATAREIASADYVCTGTDDQNYINAAITAASNAYATYGATVALTGGTFNLSGEVALKSNIELAGQRSVLKIGNQILSAMTGDVAAGQKNVNVADTAGFVVGMQVELRDTQPKWERAIIASITPGAPGVLTMVDNISNAYQAALTGRVFSSFSAVIARTGVSRVNVHGLVINGNKTNNPYLSSYDTFYANNGIMGYGASYMNVYDNIVDSVAMHGILLCATPYSSVRSNRSSGCGTQGIDIWTTTAATDVPNVVVADNDVFSNGQHGIQIHTGSFTSLFSNRAHHNGLRGINLLSCYNCVVASNIVHNNTSLGIQSDTCKYNTICQNQVTANTSYGIRCYANEGTIINGNVCRQNYGLNPEILVDGNSTKCSITSNSIVKTTGTTNSGISIPAGGDNYNTVSDNVLTGTFTNRIVSGGANNVVFDSIIPTADPHIVGQVWANSSVLTVSAG